MFDDNSVGSVGSFGSTWTKKDESMEEAMDRIGERMEYVGEKISEEEKVMKAGKRGTRKKGIPGEVGAAAKRVSLIQLQTRFAKARGTNISDAKKAELIAMKNRSIANATHFGTYTRTEVMELAELLYTMDVDGDGTIAASEFEYYIKKGKYGQTFAHLQFEVMDTDKSGEITPEEIICLVFHKASAWEQKR
jgi:hypothetical protein